MGYSQPRNLTLCFGPAVSTFAATARFSGTILLAKGNGVIFEKAIGLANRETNIPNRADTRFQIGSVSKWITVVAALKLVDDGKLSLNAPITRYLKDFPEAIGNQITVSDVLSNMSGLEDRLPTGLINKPDVAASPMRAAEAVKIYAYGPLKTKPGTTFDYAHTNWVLAQAIIEKVARQPLGNFLKKSLFEPLRLRDTGVTRGSFVTIRTGAIAYDSAASDAKRDIHVIPNFLIPTGTIYSSTHNLASLAHAVYETPMLKPATRAALSTVRFIPENYALGGRVRQIVIAGSPKRVAFEIGSIGGFKALLEHVIGEDISVVILNNTNLSEANLSRFGDQLLTLQYTCE